MKTIKITPAKHLQALWAARKSVTLFICVLLSTALFLLSPLSARAQDYAAPEVYVDTSVLQELGDFAPSSQNRQLPAQPSLKRARTKPAQAILTNPETGVTVFHTNVRTKNKETLDPAGSVSSRIEKRAVQKSRYETPPAPKAASVPARTTKMPGKTEQRTSLQTAKRDKLAKDQEASKTQNIHRASVIDHTDIPVPAIKPSITAKKHKRARAAVMTPPIPKRRPVIQKASASFVAQARARHYDLSRNEGPAVKAAPKERVYAKPLKADHGDYQHLSRADALEKKIITPARQDMVKKIEESGHLSASKSTISTKSSTQDDNAISELAALRPAARNSKAPMREETLIDITEKKRSQAHKNASKPRAPVSDKVSVSDHENDYISLAFTAGAADINDDNQKALKTDIISLLKNNPFLRLQIQAFAQPDDNGASSARRLSLSRALSIRSYLLDHGIDSARMDVRALGMQTDRTPIDRVDLVLFDKNATP